MARRLATVLAFLAAAPGLPVAQDPGATPPAQPPATSAAPSAPEQLGRLARVRLKSGQVLTGRIVSRSERELVLESEDGVRSVIPVASIAEVREADAGATRAPWDPDPNRIRYLYSPSGFMLPAGEGYVSQTELALTTVAFGLTDWLTLGVGGVVPAWFVAEGFNLIALVKVGGEVTPWLHVSASAQSFWIPAADEATTAGIGFATVTLGSPDLHLGVSAGVPFVVGDEANDYGDTVFSVSGVVRATNRVAFVTENWFFPSSDDEVMVNGFAVRFIGARLALDAGLVFVTEADVPFPWLDFTWNF